MKKKMASMVLAVVLAAATVLTGCGGSEGASTEGGDDAAQQEENADEGQTEKLVTSEELDLESIYNEDNSDIKIGLTLMTYDMSFFQDMLAQARATANELGVTLVDYDGGSDTVKQSNAVDDMVAQQVDALFLNPVDGDAIGGSVLEANAEEIPVITVDVKAGNGTVKCHVSSDNHMIGQRAAEKAVELLKEKNGSEKGFIYIIGYDPVSSVRERVEGFVEYISEYPDIEFVHEDPTSATSEAALEKMDAVLQTYGEGKLDIVFGGNETAAIGALSAADAAGRKDFNIIGVDDSPVLNEALTKSDSIYYASVVQEPLQMGKIGVELAVMAAQGMDIDATSVSTPLTVLTKENILEYEEELAATRDALKEYFD